MAHSNTNRPYGYSELGQQEQQQQQQQDYYYDDTEGYVGDYSESDDGNAQQLQNNAKELTELYRRKPLLAQTKEQYQYVNPE